MPDTKPADRHLWIFFALAYGLSWLLWIPAALSGRSVTTTAWLIPYMLGGFGPSLAGVIMVHLTRDREGRRNFWKRVVDLRRISLPWYFFIALIFPILFLVSFLVDSWLGGSLPGFEMVREMSANPPLLAGVMVSGMLSGPLSEELGWRGFALDTLRESYSPLAASLIVAPFWWAWHLPLFFMTGTTQSAWGLGAPSFWLFAIGTVPLSILLTYVCTYNDRSILAAVLLHFTYNFTVTIVHPSSLRVRSLHGLLLAIMAIGMIIAGRARSISPSAAREHTVADA